jgi:hypothetical protein
MPKNLDVGRGWRTPAKHQVMCSMLGQEIGASRCMSEIKHLVWIDLTAGDAAPVDGIEWRKACSPAILADYAKASSKPVGISLYEIKPATYDRLLSNLEMYLSSLGYVDDGHGKWRYGEHITLRAFNGSGHNADVSSLGRGEAVFVLNDPNAITEWAMRNSFAEEITERTWLFRSLSTMGCNAGGIKRLPRDERQAWFELIETQQKFLPSHRDLLLVVLEKDSAQWAYLLNTSEKWRRQTEALVRTAFNKIGRMISMSWFRQGRESFEDAKRNLFLTRTELKTNDITI